MTAPTTPRDSGPPAHPAPRIVSGGQTGVDRAALDWAVARGIGHGGWCPHGRMAEDGVIPPEYALRETGSADYAVRTERNVLESDATLIIAREVPLTGGTRFTDEMARAHGRPVCVALECDALSETVARVRDFLAAVQPRVLNVAGPRESQAPGLGGFVWRVLDACLLGTTGRN